MQVTAVPWCLKMRRTPMHPSHTGIRMDMMGRSRRRAVRPKQVTTAARLQEETQQTLAMRQHHCQKQMTHMEQF